MKASTLIFSMTADEKRLFESLEKIIEKERQVAKEERRRRKKKKK